MKTIRNYIKEFEETRFVKEGGSCFECCDYEEMRSELWQFIEQMAREMLQEVQPDNMRQNAEPLYKIGYLEAQRNVQIKKELILGETEKETK